MGAAVSPLSCARKQLGSCRTGLRAVQRLANISKEKSLCRQLSDGIW